MEQNNDLTRSALKLMRAMRRRPMQNAPEFPPAVGRTLMMLQANDGASPAELCECMDVRPSSMSELLGRMEEHGLVRRVSNEADKRATKVFLTDTGSEAVQRIQARFREENDRLAACFTAEEAAQFCALCDRLSAHMEELAQAQGTGCAFRGPHCGPHGHHGPHGGPHGDHHGHHRGPKPSDQNPA